MTRLICQIVIAYKGESFYNSCKRFLNAQYPKEENRMANEFKNEFWTVTSGDLAKKRDQLKAPEMTAAPAEGAAKIVVDPSQKFQDWIGAGAAITDSAAKLIWNQTPEQRDALLHELFDPEQGAYSVVRVPIGSCDFQSQDYYSYDDVPFGEHDHDLLHFSIGEGEPGAPDATKDLKYIVPVLQEIVKINPAIKVLGSPWSGPAWMKNTGHLTQGGHLRFGEFTGNGFAHKDRFEAVYANYFVKYIQAYAQYGIPIYGITIQNEPSNAAKWPAMIWTFPELAEFGYRFLRPALDETYPDTKIYYWDGSLNVLDKPLSEYITPQQASAFDGFAFHTYDGPYTNLNKVRREFPNWKLAMTERRCLFSDTVEDASHIMFGLNGNWLVRQGMNFITLWNLALDERGLPNAAGSTGRRGVITIDHTTGKVQRNLEYYMLRNLSQDVPAGSVRIGSTSYSPDGYTGGIASTAFLAPDGSVSAQLYNPTGKDLQASLNLSGFSTQWQTVTVPAWGTVTVHKSNGWINESAPREDEEFELHPTALNLSDDKAPGVGINAKKNNLI